MRNFMIFLALSLIIFFGLQAIEIAPEDNRSTEEVYDSFSEKVEELKDFFANKKPKNYEEFLRVADDPEVDRILYEVKKEADVFCQEVNPEYLSKLEDGFKRLVLSYYGRKIQK